MNNKQLMDSDEAAEYLGLKRTTLEAWRCKGGGPLYLKLGRAVKYRLADLDAFIEERVYETTRERAQQ